MALYKNGGEKNWRSEIPPNISLLFREILPNFSPFFQKKFLRAFGAVIKIAKNFPRQIFHQHFPQKVCQNFHYHFEKTRQNFPPPIFPCHFCIAPIAPSGSRAPPSHLPACPTAGRLGHLGPRSTPRPINGRPNPAWPGRLGV